MLDNNFGRMSENIEYKVRRSYDLHWERTFRDDAKECHKVQTGGVDETKSNRLSMLFVYSEADEAGVVYILSDIERERGVEGEHGELPQIGTGMLVVVEVGRCGH